METKSLKKQLMAAIAMLVVAAIALASATYAWFAQNTSVTASQTSISAKSDVPFLLIANAEAGDYATSTTIEAEAEELLLTTPLNVASNVAYYATADATDTTTPDKFAAADSVLWGTTYSTKTAEVQEGNVTTLVPADDLGKYVLTTHVYIKTSENTVAQNLVMDPADVTAGTNSISGAYRILAVCGDKYMLYDQRTGEVTGDKALVAEVDSEKVNDITLYVYFDGTDADSKTDNATDLSAITSVLNFSVDAVND